MYWFIAIAKFAMDGIRFGGKDYGEHDRSGDFWNFDEKYCALAGMRGIMGNVFKRLVRREFGEENYARYCRYIFYETGKRRVHNPMIYEDMYRFLEGKDRQVLLFMKHRLDGVLLQAFVICRGYLLKLAAAFATFFMFWVIRPQQPVFGILLGILALGIGAKTYEYVVNKYSYVDARIILIYKNVLDTLCIGGKAGGSI
ncbi:MAG: hypothetical protein K2P87_08755 [Lachnospiraceae bacterium]|nr:hypothetical protein [Lachnospiraceae bacterium]